MTWVWGTYVQLSILGFLLLAPSRCESGAGTRSLLQDVVTVNNARSVREVFSDLRSSQTVVLEFTSLRLPDTWVIDEEDVKIMGGGRNGDKPIVKCPKDKPALVIRASGVVVENVVFEGCDGNNSTVIVHPRVRPFGEEVIVSSILFSGVEFKNNRAREGHNGGGNLAAFEASVAIEDSLFENNIQDFGLGGAVSIITGLLSVKNSTFRNNYAGSAGGAILCDGQAKLEEDPAIDSFGELGLRVSDCTFEGNSVLSESRGGDFRDITGAPLEKLTFYTFDNVFGQGGAMKMIGFTDVLVENSTFVGNEAPSGGALYIQYDAGKEAISTAGITVTDCNFISNAAVYPESKIEDADDLAFGFFEQDENLLSGGAVFAVNGEDDLDLSFRSCSFEENRAVFGGGLHLVASDTAEIEISDCIFENNAAKKAGGGAVLRNAGNVRWSNTHVRGCSAEIGGGVLLTNNAKLNILGPDPRGENGYTNSIFEGNVAVDGAGLMCALCAASTWQSPWFIGNKARRNGGGVAIIDAVTDVFIQQGNFTDNIALRGGGAHVDGSYYLKLFTPPSFSRGQFSGNRAVSGAGLLLVPRSHRRNLMEVTNVDFKGNEAVKLDELVADLEEVNATIANNYNVGSSSRKLLQDEAGGGIEFANSGGDGSDCGPAGGGGLCVVMDKIPEASSSTVTLFGLDMIGNKAGVGGGAYIRVAGFVWQPRRCQNVSPTPSSELCRTFEILYPTFIDNTAVFAGAGLFVSDPTKVSLIRKDGQDCAARQGIHTNFEVLSLDAAWARDEAKDFCFVFEGNTVEENDGLFGGKIASKGFGLIIDPPLEILNNQTSGFHMTPFTILVVDAFNQTVTGGLPDAEVDVTIESTGATGQLVYRAHKGVVTINNTQAVGNHTNHILSFSADGMDGAKLLFNIRDCFPGEFEGENFQDCRKCEEDSYSFIPTGRCAPCEKHATCLGGASLVPMNGYWHSTPYSPHFQECIIREACDYEDREKVLMDFYSDLSKLVPSNISIPNEEYKQCSQGYRGILCGSCLEAYGHFSGGQCKKCGSVKGTVTIVLLGLLWSLVLVGFEIMSNISANKDFLRHFDDPPNAGNGGIGPIDEENREQEMRPISDIAGRENPVGGNHHVQARGGQPRKKNPARNIPTNVEAAEKLTETFKIFINYLQVTSLAVTINLSWAKVVKVSLQIQEFAAGLSGGSAIVPLDCTFEEKTSTPRSITALWFRILYPSILLVIILIFVVAMWGMAKIKNRVRSRNGRALPSSQQRAVRALALDNLVTYCIIVTVAVAFFAYNGVTEELMRTVNCLELETETGSTLSSANSVFTALPSGAVWAEDTDLTCFHGQHTATGVFGVLFLLLFSCGFILLILGLLKWELRKGPTAIWEVKFLSRFGFLYRSYRTDGRFTIYWEAVVTLRKAFIGAVVVYAYPLGPNLQAVLALGVLMAALILHLLNSPYQDFEDTRNCGGPMGKIHDGGPTLNHLETMSLFMSLVTFYSGIVFNDNNTSEAGRVVMTIVVIILHISFVVYMVVFRIWGGLHVLVDEKIRALSPNRSKDVADKKFLLPKVVSLVRVSVRNYDPNAISSNQDEKGGDAV